MNKIGIFAQFLMSLGDNDWLSLSHVSVKLTSAIAFGNTSFLIRLSASLPQLLSRIAFFFSFYSLPIPLAINPCSSLM
ncbi:MAG: hypothetical protein V2I33_16730, partial [Kangiellaceae bacterium]|nr:hypothetical protein [Kangiellaceae bacterium]